MRLHCIAEFAVSAVQRAQQWKPESPEHQKLREVLRPFLACQWQEHGDVVTELLDLELSRAKKATRDEMASLFHPLMTVNRNTVPTPCGHGDKSVAAHEDLDIDETNTERRRKKEEYEHGAISGYDGTASEVTAEVSEMLIMEDRAENVSRSLGPTEATKRSALAM
ncbi:hypothetical protein NO357_15850 [Marimonas arenosa]|uniref:Uncharacterized protein n=2 Tax=Marimonas arenosa TaxID=1795305 RepID=A0AAE3WET2_9RHOB|nr:hypothetical protein [Marimonas arenosa]